MEPLATKVVRHEQNFQKSLKVLGNQTLKHPNAGTWQDTQESLLQTNGEIESSYWDCSNSNQVYEEKNSFVQMGKRSKFPEPKMSLEQLR